jgi:hypothetical protein
MAPKTNSFSLWVSLGKKYKNMKRLESKDNFSYNEVNTVKPAHVVTSIKSNLPMWSPLLSQTCPCGHLH